MIMGKITEKIRRYNAEWESKPWAKGTYFSNDLYIEYCKRKKYIYFILLFYKKIAIFVG